MSEKPIFYQLFNKSTPPPARPSDLKLAHWKPGINLLSASAGQKQLTALPNGLLAVSILDHSQSLLKLSRRERRREPKFQPVLAMNFLGPQGEVGASERV
jgi:hypothetical protein